MVALKNRADSGDIEAQKHYAEFEEINKNIQSQEWYNVLFLVGFIAIVIVVIVIWRQKVKMRITLDEIKNGSDPDHLNYQSRRTSSSHDSSQDSYGWKPGSRGPEPEHKSKEREEHSVN